MAGDPSQATTAPAYVHSTRSIGALLLERVLRLGGDDGRRDRARQAGVRHHRPRARPRMARPDRVRARRGARARDGLGRRPLRPAPRRVRGRGRAGRGRDRARLVCALGPPFRRPDLRRGVRARHRPRVRGARRARAALRHRAARAPALARGPVLGHVAGRADRRAGRRRRALRAHARRLVCRDGRAARRRRGRDLRGRRARPASRAPLASGRWHGRRHRRRPGRRRQWRRLGRRRRWRRPGRRRRGVRGDGGRAVHQEPRARARRDLARPVRGAVRRCDRTAAGHHRDAARCRRDRPRTAAAPRTASVPRSSPRGSPCARCAATWVATC